MMYVIMGRTASGKDHFAELLKQQGLTGVKSYTTRPKRSEKENTHIFVSQDEANELTDRVAYTRIGNYEYFATAYDVIGKDFYIIDPAGLITLATNMPDMIFCIIYIKADKEERKRHFVARQSCSKEDAEKIFEERDKAETEQFDAFEAKIDALMKNRYANMADMKLPENICAMHTILNQFEMKPDKFVDKANAIVNQKKCHHILTQMALEAIELGIVGADSTNQIAVYYENNPTTPTYVRPEIFANLLMNDTEGLGSFMNEYLGRSKRLEIKSRK